jgi:hypothetical protein
MTVFARTSFATRLFSLVTFLFLHRYQAAQFYALRAAGTVTGEFPLSDSPIDKYETYTRR